MVELGADGVGETGDFSGAHGRKGRMTNYEWRMTKG
jgi:hypothetical protein